jgi:hypothetical protein
MIEALSRSNPKASEAYIWIGSMVIVYVHNEMEG